MVSHVSSSPFAANPPQPVDAMDLVNEDTNEVAVLLRALIFALICEEPCDDSTEQIVIRYSTYENLSVFTKFDFEKIKQILADVDLTKKQRPFIHSVLRKIYHQSFINDNIINNLATTLKKNLDALRPVFEEEPMLDDGHIQASRIATEIARIRSEFQNSKMLDFSERINSLMLLLGNKIFESLTPLQLLLDETVLNRLDDYLKYDRSQFYPLFSIPANFVALLRQNINNLKEFFASRHQIGEEIHSCNREIIAQNSVNRSNVHNSVVPSKIDDLKLKLKLYYGKTLWMATFQHTLMLIHQSYDSNHKLRKTLEEMGLESGKSDVQNFLTFKNFNQFLCQHFSDKDIDADDLVEYFLNAFSEQQLNEILHNLCRSDKDMYESIWLASFSNLRISFEDL